MALPTYERRQSARVREDGTGVIRLKDPLSGYPVEMDATLLTFGENGASLLTHKRLPNVVFFDMDFKLKDSVETLHVEAKVVHRDDAKCEYGIRFIHMADKALKVLQEYVNRPTVTQYLPMDRRKLVTTRRVEKHSRRTSPRYPVEFPIKVSITTPTGTFELQKPKVKSISETGIAIETSTTHTQIEPDSTVSLTIHLQEKEFNFSGKARLNRVEDTEGKYLYGVQFYDRDNRLRESLRDFREEVKAKTSPLDRRGDAIERRRVAVYAEFPKKGTFAYVTKVLLGDSSLFGNVYFAKYFEWQGKAREAFFQHFMGSDFHSFIQQGIKLITVEAYHRFKHETQAFEELSVLVSATAVTPATVKLQFRFFNNRTKTLLGEGKQTIAFAGPHQKVIPVPEVLRKNIQPYVIKQEDSLLRGRRLEECQRSTEQ